MQRLMCRAVNFRDDQSGAITAFVAVVFLLMFVAVGMAVDFMRHETYRSELQSAVDRGVLAAASMNQLKDPKQTVHDYIQSANFVADRYLLAFDEEKTIGSRKITATATYTLPTYFLKVIGINSMEVSATGIAYEGVNNIEVSLALDISGSMARERTVVGTKTLELMNAYPFQGKLGWGGVSTDVSRLDLLRVAAANFVDMILNNTNRTTTTINLVPFAGQVNLGATIFDEMVDVRRHNFSQCVDFTQEDFDKIALPGKKSRKHVPHFQWFTFEGDDGHEAEWGWCPSNTQSIEYMSNNATKLKNRIADLTAHDGTGTQNGMKWALGLLDPNSNALIKKLVAADVVEDKFADRPKALETRDTMKVIILMSDGNTTKQKRPKESSLPPGFLKKGENDEDYKWSRQLLQHSSREATELFTETEGRDDLKALCQKAEDKDVIVFTIGFDIADGSSAQTDLKECASDEAFFFDVNGDKLNNAFTAIASTIIRLRLVQ